MTLEDRPLIAPATPRELDPLLSASLCQRFPNLAMAMDSESMRPRLQSLLLDGTGLMAEACAPPKAEVNDGTCWLQYQLQVRTPGGESRDLLALGTMFADPGAAAKFERASLAPLAARWRPPLPAPKPTGILAPLSMAVSVFPINGALPTLVEATNPDRVSEVLPPALFPGSLAVVTGVELIKLRRTRGCVLCYHLGGGGVDAMVFGKVGYVAATKVVRNGLTALAQLMSPRRSGRVLVPSPLGHSAELDLTLISSLPGSRPDMRREAPLIAAVEAAAVAAAAVHTSGIPVGGSRTLADELARARHAVRLIGEEAPALAWWLTTVIDRLEVFAAKTKAQPAAFAHGDFTPSQLLVGTTGIGILDFDKLCQAEPALDLGRFLAYLRMALEKYGNAAGGAMATRFLDTYRSHGGRTGDPGRVEVYEAASLVRMAARSWQQLKPARLQLVCEVLRAAIDALGVPHMPAPTALSPGGR